MKGLMLAISAGLAGLIVMDVRRAYRQAVYDRTHVRWTDANRWDRG